MKKPRNWRLPPKGVRFPWPSSGGGGPLFWGVFEIKMAPKKRGNPIELAIFKAPLKLNSGIWNPPQKWLGGGVLVLAPFHTENVAFRGPHPPTTFGGVSKFRSRLNSSTLIWLAPPNTEDHSNINITVVKRGRRSCYLFGSRFFFETH